MEENKDCDLQIADKTVKKGLKGYLADFAVGIAIGIAFIIPGFSGGSVAAILGVYEKLINAIANIFKEFKKSVITLLPIGLGLIVGALALMFPLGYFLEHFPLPTVSLFVGLAIGGIPSLSKNVKGKPTANNVIALSVPLTLALLLSFIPVGADVNLIGISFGGYLLLFLVGIIGSCALVVPGISGSMLLLILGYYNPIVNLITDHLFRLKDLTECILVLGSCGLGIVAGFFLISVFMKKMLTSYPRGTHFAIIGFIVGSLPTVYISTMKEAGMISSYLAPISLPTSVFHYVVCIFLVLAGVCASFSFSQLFDKNK